MLSLQTEIRRVGPPPRLSRSVRGRLDVIAHHERAHALAAQAVQAALAAVGVAPRDMQAEVQLSGYGARMALFVRLPRAWDFDPGDGHAVGLRLACFSTADTDEAPRVRLDWQRYVSGTCLPLGLTRFAVANAEDLAQALEEAERERVALLVWRKTPVPLARLVQFADEALTAAWGVKAAARLLHIATTGFDGELATAFEPGPAHTRTLVPARRVPGAPVPAKSAYDAAQGLAWLAREKREAEVRAAWEGEIGGLMEELLKR